MDLRRIRYFVAVAEHLSFRGAAEALDTSQPSLSQQIRGLERDLGVELFERTKRRVRLTNAGAEYLAGVRNVIAEFEATGRRARDAEAGLRGRLELGTAGMVMIDHLPNVVRAYRAAFPAVDVSVTILRNPDLVDALRRGRIDLAFASVVEPSDEIVTEHLWSFPSRVVLPADHPMAGRPAIHLSELNGETLIVHQRRNGGGANGVVMGLCREQGFTPGAIREVSDIADLEMLVGLVACGLGITILPAPFERMHSPAVVFVPISGTLHAAHISACWRSEQISSLVRNFVRIARESEAALAHA